MSRRASAIAAVLGLLLAGVPGGADACPLATSGDHTCCAETAPQPPASCCSDPTEPDPGADFACDCDHFPDAHTTVTSAPQRPERDDGSCTLRGPVDRVTSLAPSTIRVAADSAPETHAPPLLFLLDCAFLI